MTKAHLQASSELQAVLAHEYAHHVTGKPDGAQREESMRRTDREKFIEHIRELCGKDRSPDLCYSGEHIKPPESSVRTAEYVIRNLPENVQMPRVCVPEDGDICFSWKAKEGDSLWKAALTVGPDRDVAGYVGSDTDRASYVPFEGVSEDDGTVELDPRFVRAMIEHWRVAS